MPSRRDFSPRRRPRIYFVSHPDSAKRLFRHLDPKRGVHQSSRRRVALDGFRVTLRPDEEARLVHIGGDRHKAGNGTCTRFIPPEGYMGAVVYSGPKRRISLFPVVDAYDLLGC